MILNTQEYLKRLGMEGSVEVSLSTLILLQRAHVRTFPFENTHILSGEKINLDADKLYEKIVTGFHGGVCYELNTLFCLLLRSLGYEVMVVSAITKYGDDYGEEFDHMALVVSLDDQHWLVDVGLREAMNYPIKILKGQRHKFGRRSYSVDHCGDQYFLLKHTEDQIFEEYKFRLIAREFNEFSSMFHFHETNPRSPLNQYLICTIGPGGNRISMKADKIFVEKKNVYAGYNIDQLTEQGFKKYCLAYGLKEEFINCLFTLSCRRHYVAA